MAEPFWTRHKGPYQLQVLRKVSASGRYKLGWSAEAISGSVDGPDVADEAEALLTDPRDSIVAVFVWSVPESQHVCTYSARNM